MFNKHIHFCGQSLHWQSTEGPFEKAVQKSGSFPVLLGFFKSFKEDGGLTISVDILGIFICVHSIHSKIKDSDLNYFMIRC